MASAPREMGLYTHLPDTEFPVPDHASSSAFAVAGPVTADTRQFHPFEGGLNGLEFGQRQSCPAPVNRTDSVHPGRRMVASSQRPSPRATSWEP